ncbi:hypothetical protein AMJ39_00060 [candidate division TA06 bacterium DG_24]|uniref:Pyridoxamine 5'-phosphate oxidase N-terminal domain-containing protein n=3 Tax=Bacteria division TA06 TaxID=1156500 RepID=A0A0S8JKD6_UNCT6|nr:MAG: hypothetical protein AMJ39_00060 [candidate division TA06 bacterium DG_24]KPK69844.1 MAG: hypothetical protein AMJ82_04525 [candidate division TA06 bacterium SM23_40]KPL10244.1 MAG: hypothetical protein AMJ71_03840 [candidate division TA06 bacterium SM1_40]
MKDILRLKETVRKLLAGQRLAVLATHGQTGPYANLVAFAATDDLKHVLFATGRSTRKFANMEADARVALLVDNRANEESDFQEASAATIMGRAEPVPEAAKGALAQLYLRKHPSMREFIASPACAFLRVNVETYYLVTRFQDVVELRISE